MGKFTQAEKHLNRALELYNREEHRAYVRLYGQDPAVTCLCYAAFVAWHLGYPDRARSTSLETLYLARDLSHPLSLVVALCFSAQLYQRLQEPSTVQTLAGEAGKIAEKHGFVMWSTVATIMRGWSLGAQGLIEEGIEQMCRGLSKKQSMESWLVDRYFLALLAELYRKAGRVEEGLKNLSRALATVDVTEVRIWEPELYRLKGELLQSQGGDGNEAAAEACFRQAARISRGQMNRALDLRATVSLSRLLLERGERAEARRVLAKVYDSFTEGFDTPDLIQAKELLEDLE